MHTLYGLCDLTFVKCCLTAIVFTIENSYGSAIYRISSKLSKQTTVHRTLTPPLEINEMMERHQGNTF